MNQSWVVSLAALALNPMCLGVNPGVEDWHTPEGLIGTEDSSEHPVAVDGTSDSIVIVSSWVIPSTQNHLGVPED